MQVPLSLTRLEAFYRCANRECRHGFFRNLTPDATCIRVGCGHRNFPLSERVLSDVHVKSSFECAKCKTKWEQTFLLSKHCHLCYSRAFPVAPEEAVGAAHAWCAQCGRVSYNLNAQIGHVVQCRNCPGRPLATVVCSPMRRRALDSFAPTLQQHLAMLRQVIYVPNTLRTHVTQLAPATRRCTQETVLCKEVHSPSQTAV